LFVIVAVVLMLLAMLVAGARKAAALRASRDLGPADDDVEPYRSHAEASRRAPSEKV
jgi:hypothetical protein